MIYCIGNFDGVHPGHAGVINHARKFGKALSVLTFDPHPRQYFVPKGAPFRLTNSAQRAAYLRDLGVERIVELPFDSNFAILSAEKFACTILLEQLNASLVIAGEDFRFGNNRSGDMHRLADLGRDLGFDVRSIELHKDGDKPLSSSRIRHLLREGLYADAVALWGRFFTVESRVLRGDQLGRTLGFPTANLDFGAYLRPAFGVYASWAYVPGKEKIASVTNIGRRPTVNGVQDRFETHLFNFTDELYGQEIRVELVYFIRPEQRFDGLDALKSQIAMDCEKARSMLISK